MPYVRFFGIRLVDGSSGTSLHFLVLSRAPIDFSIILVKMYVSFPADSFIFKRGFFAADESLGMDCACVQVIDERLEHCMAHAAGDAEACEMCAGTDRCKLETMEDQTSG